MFFHIDAAVGAKRYALAFEPFALLGKVLCEPPGVVYNAVADTCPDTASGANATFREINKYLNWTDAGVLNALNASTADDLTPADLERAYELGRKL